MAGKLRNQVHICDLGYNPGVTPLVTPAAVLAAAAAIERELLSGKDYSMAQDSDEALARVALEAAAPILAGDLEAELAEARSELKMIQDHANLYLRAAYGPDVVYRAPETFRNMLERWIWAVAAGVPEIAHACIADIERYAAEDGHRDP